jgi:predicted phosphodiesterase
MKLLYVKRKEEEMNLKKILLMLMTFVLLITSANLPVSAATENFDDVKGHWAEKNINWSQERDLVKGYPDGEFKPEGKITKAEFITIINNFMKAEEGRDFKFKDVKKSDWYYEEVRKAVNYYLKDEDYFRGDDYIDRDEASKLIAAVYGLKEVELNDFNDRDEIINKGAVASLADKKVLNGYPDGSFKPKNPITRAEASKIFNVAYDNIGEPSTSTALNPNKEEKTETKSNTSVKENKKEHHHNSSSHNDNSNDDTVKFGVISDIHLRPDNPTQVERTTKALNFFEENGAASSFIVGDVTDNGKEEEYKEYDKVKSGLKGDKMEVHASMGNHENLTTELFTKYFGNEPNSHYKINGYHFIMISPDAEGGESYLEATKWLSEELKKAKDDTGDKPIFVFFHHPVKDTFYVSDDWYGDVPKSIFKDYPMAVTFSGHIHSPNNHPRSIWQGNFTAVNTVSLYYFEMEKGYNKGETYPKNSELCAQGLLVEADGTKVTIKNRDFISDKWIDETWTFDTAHPEDFPYTDARYDEAKAPKFDKGTEVKVTDINSSDKKKSVNLEFDQAKVDPNSVKGDIVHSYEFEIKEEGKQITKTEKDWSGFYLIPMPEKMNMRLDELKPDTEYTVDIYPVDAFKKKGEPITVTFKTSVDTVESNEDISNKDVDINPDEIGGSENTNKDSLESGIGNKEDSSKDIVNNSNEESINN